MDLNLLTPDTAPQWAENFRAEFGCYPIAGAEAVTQGDAGAADAPADGGETGEQPPADDGLARLDGRMTELTQSLAQMAERLPQPDASPDPAQQAAAQSLEEFFGAAPQPDQGQQQQQPAVDPDDEIRQLIDPVLGSALDQRVRPALEQILTRIEASDQRAQQDRINQQTESLYSEYPQLASDQEYRGQVVGEAQAWAQDMGADEQVARSPVFIELVHLAHQTLDRAAQENPAGQTQGQGSVTGPAGASLPPAGQPTEQDRAQAIREAGPPRGGIFG